MNTQTKKEKTLLGKIPFLIGLTGGISSGKSTVTSLLRQKGFVVLDLDQISRDIMKPDSPTYLKVKEVFQDEDIFDENGVIIRQKLGDLIFQDPSAKRLLQNLTHPAIRKELSRQMFVEFLKFTPVVILDSPLLFEAGLHQTTFKNIVVDIDDDTQLQRLIKRDNLSEKQAKSRIAAQMPLAEKRKQADFIVDNNGDLKDLERNVDLLVKKISPSPVLLACTVGGRLCLLFLAVWLLYLLLTLFF